MYSKSVLLDIPFFKKTIDTTEYELDPIEINANGEYLFPAMPCGILPFFLNEKNEIVWGCVEDNRIGIKVIHPPAGTQDIIVVKENERFVIEASKPFPEFNKEFLSGFTRKTVADQNYQDILNCFIKNGYKIFLENTLATAAHETQEEHGVDLRKTIGVHNNLLVNMVEFEPQTILAKRGTTTQKIYVAHLNKFEDIRLNYAEKREDKIAINRGRSFYEKGIWCTLEDLKLCFTNEKSIIENEKNDNSLNSEKINLIKAGLIAYESRIALLEKIEASIVSGFTHLKINSIAQTQGLNFIILEQNDNKTDNENVINEERSSLFEMINPVPKFQRKSTLST